MTVQLASTDLMHYVGGNVGNSVMVFECLNLQRGGPRR